MSLLLTTTTNPGTAEWKYPQTGYTSLIAETAIPVDESASYTFSVATNTEDNTLAPPQFIGQMITLRAGVMAPAAQRNIVVGTVFNSDDENTIEFATEDGYAVLFSIPNPLGGFLWRLIAWEDVTLTTTP